MAKKTSLQLKIEELESDVLAMRNKIELLTTIIEKLKEPEKKQETEIHNNEGVKNE